MAHRHTTAVRLTGLVCLGLALAACTAGGGVDPTGTATSTTSGIPTRTAPPTLSASGQLPRTVVIETDDPGQAQPLADRLRADSLDVTSVNTAVGMVTVASDDAGLPARLRAMSEVKGAATDREIGWAPPPLPKTTAPTATGSGDGNGMGKAPTTSGDPLDGWLWGMRMVKADKAHTVTSGATAVRVGVIDTGIDATHPDLAANIDVAASRNWVTDDPAIDGPCEVTTCVDPVTVDGDQHGTHVAGIIAAAANGIGVTGVAPKVTLVNDRAGQDSGLFFLGPVVNAITYAADARLDVVNMSFYVDPWLWSCRGGAPGDSAEQIADQDVIIDLMDRALTYAHDHNVTMVAALGNEDQDIAKPVTDTTSPDYGGVVRNRAIDRSRCYDLPVNGAHVIGVSSVGSLAQKATYSNWTSDPGGTDLEVAAPGGSLEQRPNGTGLVGGLILSTVPEAALQNDGMVAADGAVTAFGAVQGVVRSCQAPPVPTAARCGYYAMLAGTSMASPMVTGVAALVISRAVESGRPRPSPDEVAAALMRSADQRGCADAVGAGDDATCVAKGKLNGVYGAGIVDAYAAVRAG